MSRQTESRNINLSHARVSTRRAAHGGTQRAAHTAAVGKRAAPHRRRKKKKSVGRRIATVLGCIALVLALAVGGVYLYVENLFRPGEMGTLSKPSSQPNSGTDSEPQQATVPEAMTGTKNILVLGIDYSEEDAVKRDPIGNTDMLLYVRVNASDHTMMMTQFPRDIFVGDIGGASGKINGIFAHSADTANRVNTVAQYLTKAFGLPIDNYVTIDMDSLKEIVDLFVEMQGGLNVYVPKAMEYNGSRIEQGWHVMDGETCEFFLRQRHDSSATPRGDFDRLGNHRYFYSAVFRAVRSASIPDLLKLTPVVQKYINTDLGFFDLVQLGMAVLSTPSSNITMGRIPAAQGQDYYNKGTRYSVVVCAKPETADFLNEYLRPADDPISASQIGTPDWPTVGSVVPAEVARMGEVDVVGSDETGAPAA